MAEPTLNLQTLIRPIVAIDGVPYELRHPDELSIFEYERHHATAMRLSVLMNLPQRTDHELDEWRGLVDAQCRRALIAPDVVHARLSDNQRMQIVTAFFALRPTSNRATAGPTTPTRTGASSSPVSLASMEAIPSHG